MWIPYLSQKPTSATCKMQKKKKYAFIACVPVKFFPIYNLLPFGEGIVVFSLSPAGSSIDGDNFKSTLVMTRSWDELCSAQATLWEQQISYSRDSRRDHTWKGKWCDLVGSRSFNG